MRKTSLIFLVLMLSAGWGRAQSTVPDPAHMKAGFEDERLRVLLLTLEPGQDTGNIFIGESITTWVLPGKIEFIYHEGDPERGRTTDGPAGLVEHLAYGNVSIKNVGKRKWEAVITEFKVPFAKSVAPKNPTEQPQQTAKIEPTPARPATVGSENAALPTVMRPRQDVHGEPKPPVQKQAQPETPPAGDQPKEEAKPATPEPTALNADGAKIAFLNGTELAYIERGSGPVVVLVHDTLGDYRSWAQQLAVLSRNHRVIAYSRRYHYPNHSNGKERDYNYDINAKDLADFIKGLNVGAVRLVGFGYGASVAGMVAAEHPELIKALVLTEPGYEQLLDKTMAFRSQFAREEVYGIIRKPLTKEKIEKGIQVYVDWQGYKNWSDLSTEEHYREKQNTNALHAQTLDAAAPNFNCATAKKITAATLILSGQRRSANSAEIAGVLSACIPNAERATVANSGAAIYVDNPQEADKLLAEFLAKH